MKSNELEPVSIVLTTFRGEKIPLLPFTNLFEYYEDINEPFVRAVLNITDSGDNLISKYRFQGGEDVVIQMKCYDGTNIKELVEYKFKVWKIYNRNFAEGKKIQNYNIALAPREAFINEYQKVVRRLSGKVSEIVEDLLSNFLEVDSTNLDIETTGNSYVYYPSRRSPIGIIQNFLNKSISIKGFNNSKSKTKETPSTTSVSNENSENDATLKGTAGYAFFQNKNGFVFKSLDKICDSGKTFGGNKPIFDYYAQQVSDIPGDAKNYRVIENYRFESEIDLIEKMRQGLYSTKVVTFDPSKGVYEEFTYSLKDTFDNMAKLGNQSKLPKFAVANDKGELLPPTRTVSFFVDNELWHNKTTIGDPDEGGNAEFPDLSKSLLVQSMSRRMSLSLQKLSLAVPGNSELVVGEKLKVYLPNMSQEESRRNDPWDRESSGNYLISKVKHTYFLANPSGQIFETTLELCRDTYGMEETSSKTV